MIYDIIIIGAGASGLFASANIKLPKGSKGLIINKSRSPGLKLLMAGSGQCNITHSGDIRRFTEHYGDNGKKIRSVLFGFNNRKLTEWFSQRGLETVARPDGKIFPKTMSGKHILNLLLSESSGNGFEIKNSCSVTNIQPKNINNNDNWANNINTNEPHVPPNSLNIPLFSVITTSENKKITYTAKQILIACGGCSYPATGSDGSIFDILKHKGITITPCKPALVPIDVRSYPYGGISGNSVKNARVTIYKDTKTKKSPHITGDILLTHKNFSGPAILDISRFAEPGHILEINWFPTKTDSDLISEINALRKSNKKQFITVIYDYMQNIKLPNDQASIISQSHLELICKRAEIDPSSRFSDINNASLKKFIQLITQDKFIITQTGGYNIAMATRGGISLTEIDLSSMESRKYPNLYFCGETIDIDGDTGGYNLQFAFSSAYLAAKNILQKLT
ncbi:MAG: aminoacetone oxidase family FAD-binding enzyme [Firmicutes bacterium]|nr:aminoacetone oxidase family FAD-binding enzyme [Bacillota bacterium]